MDQGLGEQTARIRPHYRGQVDELVVFRCKPQLRSRCRPRAGHA